MFSGGLHRYENVDARWSDGFEVIVQFLTAGLELPNVTILESRTCHVKVWAHKNVAKSQKRTRGICRRFDKVGTMVSAISFREIETSKLPVLRNSMHY